MERPAGRSGPQRCCVRGVLGLESGARGWCSQQGAVAFTRRALGSGPGHPSATGDWSIPRWPHSPVDQTGVSLGGEVHRRWHGGVSGPKTPHVRWSWRNQASRPTAPIREVAMADAPLRVTAEAGAQASGSQVVPESVQRTDGSTEAETINPPTLAASTEGSSQGMKTASLDLPAGFLRSWCFD